MTMKDTGRTTEYSDLHQTQPGRKNQVRLFKSQQLQESRDFSGLLRRKGHCHPFEAIRDRDDPPKEADSTLASP